MTFDEWREENYDSDWSDRDYARSAWNAATAAERERWIDAGRRALQVLGDLDEAEMARLRGRADAAIRALQALCAVSMKPDA